MQKSNKSIAGYHLLMILSSVDGEFAPEEGLKLQQYLADEFPFQVDLDNELDIIATLPQEKWEGHFDFHAGCFYDDSTEEERQDFINFAKSLIKADEEVTEQEHKFYKTLKNKWKMN
ncbi:tellurite resistance TerB family protein [Kaistella palustris]|uniref:tellurite resistance TerB family protein n=1 Tax=Kaistella palustris TaxID=493376 RepID=UPI0003F88AFF|nr:TerB family tellurite resistance protein [Kaistella palustris]